MEPVPSHRFLSQSKWSKAGQPFYVTLWSIYVLCCFLQLKHQTHTYLCYCLSQFQCSVIIIISFDCSLNFVSIAYMHVFIYIVCQSIFQCVSLSLYTIAWQYASIMSSYGCIQNVVFHCASVLVLKAGSWMTIMENSLSGAIMISYICERILMKKISSSGCSSLMAWSALSLNWVMREP